MKVRIASALLLLLGSSLASAADDGGFYVGAGAGQFNVELESVNSSTFDSDDTVYKFFGGWRFNPFIALELDYIDLGSPEDTVNNNTYSLEISGFAPYLIGTIPVGPVELFAKAGYYIYDIEVSQQNGSTLYDDGDEDFVYGAGVGITLFDHLHARLEYELIEAEGVESGNAIWLSGAWRF